MLLFVFTTLIPPFFSGIIGCCSAYVILRITRAHAERKAGEGDEKTWRQARLDTEKALSERISSEERARVKWELENAGDVAHIVGLLKELGETQKLLAGIATTSQHHSTDIANLTTRQNDLQNQINQFLISHAKSS